MGRIAGVPLLVRWSSIGGFMLVKVRDVDWLNAIFDMGICNKNMFLAKTPEFEVCHSVMSNIPIYKYLTDRLKKYPFSLNYSDTSLRILPRITYVSEKVFALKPYEFIDFEENEDVYAYRLLGYIAWLTMGFGPASKFKGLDVSKLSKVLDYVLKEYVVNNRPTLLMAFYDRLGLVSEPELFPIKLEKLGFGMVGKYERSVVLYNLIDIHEYLFKRGYSAYRVLDTDYVRNIINIFRPLMEALTNIGYTYGHCSVFESKGSMYLTVTDVLYSYSKGQSRDIELLSIDSNGSVLKDKHNLSKVFLKAIESLNKSVSADIKRVAIDFDSLYQLLNCMLIGKVSRESGEYSIDISCWEV